jgi:hypothetical protein
MNVAAHVLIGVVLYASVVSLILSIYYGRKSDV